MVRVRVCGELVVPRACAAKVRLEGEKDTAKAPDPLKLTVGLTTALSEMVSVAVSVPTTEGVK